MPEKRRGEGEVGGIQYALLLRSMVCPLGPGIGRSYRKQGLIPCLLMMLPASPEHLPLIAEPSLSVCPCNPQ